MSVTAETEDLKVPGYDASDNTCRLIGKGHVWGGVWESDPKGRQIKVDEHCMMCLCSRPKHQWRRDKSVG